MITLEVITPNTSNWEKYGSQIFSIETEVFNEKSFSEEMMSVDINDLKTILVILKDEDLIIGFTYATPEKEKVSCVADIAITKNYQNKGLVSILMSSLEEEMRKSGYDYVIEHAMVENGYADKILKNYKSRIIETREFVGEYGKQRYFKISL
jgi:ribosomal protein S18 acetylase RimI-like enzyme